MRVEKMSTEDAIKHIDAMIYNTGIVQGFVPDEYDIKALRMAIEALEGSDRNVTCWWKAPKDIMDNLEFEISCRDNRGLRRGRVPNNFAFGDFRYCPFCGGKIRWVRGDE